MKEKFCLLLMVVAATVFLVSYNPSVILEEKSDTARVKDFSGPENLEGLDGKIDIEEKYDQIFSAEAEDQDLEEDMHVPLPAAPRVMESDEEITPRGIYVSANIVGIPSRFRRLLHLVETTELNAMVIDVKDDDGRLTYNSDIEFANKINADGRPTAPNLPSVVRDLNNRGIYTIARLVVFRDPHLPEHKPHWMMHEMEDEEIWYDRKGMPWADPFRREVWKYNTAVAREAALMGFDEIQFDYVRFPLLSDSERRNKFFPARDSVGWDNVIARFLEYANEELKYYDVNLAADVFGAILSRWARSDNIGQDWEKIAPHVDYKSPMIYPSHYLSGAFGLDIPDAHPEQVITKALQKALERNEKLENPAKLRPWLQGFTARWLTGSINYGPQEIRAQIRAARQLGIEEYMVWNARNNYSREAFISPGSQRTESAPPEESSPGG